MAQSWKHRTNEKSDTFSLRLEVSGDHDAVFLFSREFAKNLPIAMDQALEATANKARELIREAIVSGQGLAPLRPATLMKRRLGKRKGMINPPVARYSRMTPLSRSWQYARALTTCKSAWHEYSTGIGIGLGEFSGGKDRIPIAVYAMEQEFGFMRALPVTLRMRSYLRILYQGGGRISSKHLPHKKTGKFIGIVVPGRPVWANVFAKYYESGKVDPDFFMSYFWKAMKLPGFTY